MIEVLPVVLTTASLVAAVWCGVLMALNRPLVLTKRLADSSRLTLGTLGFAALLEVGLIAQAVIGVVMMVGTTREIDNLTFVGYLLGPVAILPCTVLWSLAERTRWGAGVLLVGFACIPVMILRLQQVWAGHG